MSADNTTNSRRGRQHRQTVRLARWTAAWLVPMAFASFGPEFIRSGSKLGTSIATLLNLLAGVGMIIANRDHPRSLDELHSVSTWKRWPDARVPLPGVPVENRLKVPRA